MAGIAVTVAISVIVAVVEAGGTFAFGELINALAADPPDSTAPASTLLPIADPVFIFAVVVGFWMVPPIALRLLGAYLGRFQSDLRARIHDEVLGYVLGHAPRFFLDEGSGSVGHRIRTSALAAYLVIEFLFFRLTRSSRVHDNAR